MKSKSFLQIAKGVFFDFPAISCDSTLAFFSSPSSCQTPPLFVPFASFLLLAHSANVLCVVSPFVLPAFARWPRPIVTSLLSSSGLLVSRGPKKMTFILAVVNATCSLLHVKETRMALKKKCVCVCVYFFFFFFFFFFLSLSLCTCEEENSCHLFCL